jgi:SAM-dependent methyltransferase
MTSQQNEEVKFWRNLFKRLGVSGFLEQRTVIDFNKRTDFFPELKIEGGFGLDYGCGLVSIFERNNLQIEAYDPLLAAYDSIYRYPGSVTYISKIENVYDYIVCFNVLDHTPDPQTIISEIKKHLKHGGKVYFEVNFDPELYPQCHYMQFNEQLVDKYLKDFMLLRKRVIPNPVFPEQLMYEAVYELP